MHIDHPAEEASLDFDFTELDYVTALRGEPKAWMKVVCKNRSPLTKTVCDE